MKDRKSIDRLFQEKFKDFEAHPSEKVWSAIHAELQGEQTRKSWVNSIWSKVAGVAAALAIFFLVGDWFSIRPSSEVATQKKEMQDRPEQEPLRVELTAIAISQQPEHEPPVEEIALTPDVVSKKSPLRVVHNASSIKESGIKSYQSIAAILMDPFEAREHRENNPSDLEITGISIFDAIRPKQEGSEFQELGKGKLIVTTKAAPIFYGNMGKGNFLDSKFDSNPNQGEVTFAYGVNIAYAISDRIKLRSGINKVSMSYNTSDVPYRTAMDPSAISSISYNPNIKAREVSSVKNAQYMSTTAAPRQTGRLNTSSLNQKMGYIEVPVELQYNLLNKKIEINIIGGGSTLLLDKNVVTLETGQELTQLGKANNLNTISFSTNIGIGVDYNLSDKFKLNLEPMFKYQLNTFSSDAGMYQPYFLGIYSGFSFEF